MVHSKPKGIMGMRKCHSSRGNFVDFERVLDAGLINNDCPKLKSLDKMNGEKRFYYSCENF